MMKRILTLLLLACSLFPLCAQGYVPSESNLAARKEFTQKRLGSHRNDWASSSTGDSTPRMPKANGTSTWES